MTTALWTAAGLAFVAGVLAFCCMIMAGRADDEAERLKRAVEERDEGSDAA